MQVVESPEVEDYIGRTLGIHLLVAGQEAVPFHILDQMGFRFCLPVQNWMTSRALIGTSAAAEISTSDGQLRGKMLRKLPSDPQPVEVVAFDHSAIAEPAPASADSGADSPIAERMSTLLLNRLAKFRDMRLADLQGRFSPLDPVSLSR